MAAPPTSSSSSSQVAPAFAESHRSAGSAPSQVTTSVAFRVQVSPPLGEVTK